MANLDGMGTIEVEDIINSFHFRIGFGDYRAGRGFRTSYETWKDDDALLYEYGRLLAALAPGIKALPYSGITESLAFRIMENSVRFDDEFVQRRPSARRMAMVREFYEAQRRSAGLTVELE